MSGAGSRRKGANIEREIVALHKSIGVDAERFPLSGAMRFQGRAGDVDVYPFGRDAGALISEVKARKSGSGFKTLESWLGENDLLFLRRNHATPLVLLPWPTWERLLRGLKR